jgi:hypothetical protein
MLNRLLKIMIIAMRDKKVNKYLHIKFLNYLAAEKYVVSFPNRDSLLLAPLFFWTTSREFSYA